MNQAQAQEFLGSVANFIGRWLAISTVAYFGWTKFAPWIDSMLPF